MNTETPIESVTPVKKFISEFNEENLGEFLESAIDKKIELIETETERKVTIDSITTTVPSTALNTIQQSQHEKSLAEKERLRRRLLGF